MRDRPLGSVQALSPPRQVIAITPSFTSSSLHSSHAYSPAELAAAGGQARLFAQGRLWAGSASHGESCKLSLVLAEQLRPPSM